MYLVSLCRYLGHPALAPLRCIVLLAYVIPPSSSFLCIVVLFVAILFSIIQSLVSCF